MKSFKLSAIILSCVILFSACEKDKDVKLGGAQSPMGEVGVTVSSSSASIAGVSNFTAIVTSNEDGVSVYNGSCTVNNTLLKNMLSNIPELNINGNVVSSTSVKFRHTTEGIEFLSGPTAGIWARYDSKVGDKYSVGSTGTYRKVVSKSTTDDYPYGFFDIKVMEVEEVPSSVLGTGIKKISYYANHRFGLVGIKFTFDDNSEAHFPVYMSAEND